ncbi:diguanylate cyclase with extracellular sensor [Sulfuricurvum kujiense DSM 16994]|uniref:diguanylate cyclase n=1 Tax=Sulfuricurvum kujiense (strain ATCC BAA-921 / DSM 16994 / JCM 11577 / YK-1) TaxID=709032 RepID=E4TZR1_SULKY|nr:diguanylate cyclase [Sulfuricurvum kujiense]ADR34168.1 diguanylate cyclase with extracellular sensor [Sulfuricurvum kujiense DSM 16994]
MNYRFYTLFLFLFAVIEVNAVENYVRLTPEEQAYLTQKKVITMCVDPDWEPFEIINAEGEHVGISADLISLMAKRVGLNIKLVQTKTWDETLEKSKSGQCDILSFVNQTPEREKWLIFTQPLLSDPNILITREEHSFVADLNGLDGERVALPEGTAVLERMSKDFPNLKMIPVVSEADAMEMVSEKKADMTVRSLIVAAYVIKKEGWFNLKISGQPQGYENHLRIGVLKDEKILRDILDKGIQMITPIEREEIINKHTGLVVKDGIDRKTVLQYIALTLLIAAIFLWRYYDLKRYNAKLLELSITDKLTGIYNRLKIDERLTDEQKKVNRYMNYRCSVMMIDIDFFKTVNDTYGHQYGDDVLKQLAELMRQNFRETDVFGRWGGEEFMVIFPNTSVEDAYAAAEKFRRNVEENVRSMDKPVTVSIGLGTFLTAESVDNMLSRIDAALYDAKEQGRNRICTR